MRVIRPALCALVACTLLSAQGGLAQQGPSAGQHKIHLDIYALSQGDSGGNPHETEAFEYLALRPALDISLSERVRVKGAATLAYIVTADPEPLAETITNADVTSATPRLLTLDAVASVHIDTPDGRWTIAPGTTYHHQFNYFVNGIDLAVTRHLADGDTDLEWATNVRWARSTQRYWDGPRRGLRHLVSANLLVAWRQNWSTQWRTSLGAQYTHQAGLLVDPFNYVVLYDRGNPYLLDDERVPDKRNRGQLNARARFAPAVGWGTGLDVSAYLDDWGVVHRAAQVSLSGPAGEAILWRAWYRLSIQDGARFVADEPPGGDRYQTQDADLGAFVMHSPGAQLSWSVNPSWGLRLVLYGFFRDDGVHGTGGHIGGTFTL